MRASKLTVLVETLMDFSPKATILILCNFKTIIKKVYRLRATRARDGFPFKQWSVSVSELSADSCPTEI